MKLEVKFKNPQSQVFIPYPKGFEGRKSGSHEDTSFTVGPTPSVLTEPEVVLAEKYVKSLVKAGIKQQLLFTGVVMVEGDDPLKGKGHAELTAYEQENGLPVTETLPNGTKVLDPYERVIRIRETEARAKYAHLL